MARASDVLGDAMRTRAEQNEALPAPTPINDIALPEGCDFLGLVAVGATPPDPSERVNVYLSKSLIERIDRLAAELGMNRSSLFGLALTRLVGTYATQYGTFGPQKAKP
jgi:hypothetical protein